MDKPTFAKPATDTHKKTGTLNLFLPNSESGSEQPYARFKVCRGFIDDLNRMLPIRLRIQLEVELANGFVRGDYRGSTLNFRWEFLPD